MSERVKIVEKASIPSEALMLHGLPDVGLVGLLATSHIISQLKLSQLAYVNTDLLPPIVILQKGLPYPPLRVFGGENLIVLFSEVAIPADSIKPIIREIVGWGQLKNVRMMVSLGGIPTPNRQNIEKPKVFGVASNPTLLETLKEKGIEILDRGFMAGPQALIMHYCTERNISAIALLAQSYYQYPDPEAAAAVIEELTKITDLLLNVSDLIEKGEEIRLAARDIMKRTQPEMARMRKTQEYDMPLYV
jgi:uncharacterized protein